MPELNELNGDAVWKEKGVFSEVSRTSNSRCFVNSRSFTKLSDVTGLDLLCGKGGRWLDRTQETAGILLGLESVLVDP